MLEFWDQNFALGFSLQHLPRLTPVVQYYPQYLRNNICNLGLIRTGEANKFRCLYSQYNCVANARTTLVKHIRLSLARLMSHIVLLDEVCRRLYCRAADTARLIGTRYDPLEFVLLSNWQNAAARFSCHMPRTSVCQTSPGPEWHGDLIPVLICIIRSTDVSYRCHHCSHYNEHIAKIS